MTRNQTNIETINKLNKLEHKRKHNPSAHRKALERRLDHLGERRGRERNSYVVAEMLALEYALRFFQRGPLPEYMI